MWNKMAVDMPMLSWGSLSCPSQSCLRQFVLPKSVMHPTSDTVVAPSSSNREVMPFTILWQVHLWCDSGFTIQLSPQSVSCLDGVWSWQQLQPQQFQIPWCEGTALRLWWWQCVSEFRMRSVWARAVVCPRHEQTYHVMQWCRCLIMNMRNGIGLCGYSKGQRSLQSLEIGNDVWLVTLQECRVWFVLMSWILVVDAPMQFSLNAMCFAIDTVQCEYEYLLLWRMRSCLKSLCRLAEGMDAWIATNDALRNGMIQRRLWFDIVTVDCMLQQTPEGWACHGYPSQRFLTTTPLWEEKSFTAMDAEWRMTSHESFDSWTYIVNHLLWYFPWTWRHDDYTKCLRGQSSERMVWCTMCVFDH